ncbi:MAG: LysE family translocator [Cocleimonas sp.]|nr:LysE family translocator [Cocleimonas sp.]
MQEFLNYLPGILLAYLAFILAVASPGPNIMAVIGTSMGVGRAQGIALALGVAVGSLTWATLSVIGLSAILSTYASALYAIKIFGGAYLLWLAYKALKDAASSHNIEAKELEGGKRTTFDYAKRGYLIMMTNPKAALAWIAIISIGLKQGAPIWVGLAIVGGTFVISVVAHILYAVAFSTPIMVRMYSKARRYIQLTLGAFFAFAGIKLLTSKM